MSPSFSPSLLFSARRGFFLAQRLTLTSYVTAAPKIGPPSLEPKRPCIWGGEAVRGLEAALYTSRGASASAASARSGEARLALAAQAPRGRRRKAPTELHAAAALREPGRDSITERLNSERTSRG